MLARPMSGASTSEAALWRTRILWATLGAAVTAVLMWPQPPTSPPTEGGTPQLASPADDASPSELTRTAGVLAASEPEPEVDAEPAPSESEPVGSSGEGSSIEADSTAVDAAPTGDTEDGAALEIPLPRMPGSKLMRDDRRPDDDGDGWRLLLTLSVPAPGPQVEAFYRSALHSERMSVWGGGEAGGSMSEGHDATLKGRGHDASAEVTVVQRPGKLRTIVRVYWHAHAALGSAGP